ncbi:vomeronasal type-2 receptor 26-like [Rhinoderma darwinii]|uniref:vomeronasal type-2 receptor 26-like n=1 Tax=Rhinoderma darwinii TaxID=43563 RepID=UPI003F671366
MAFIFAIDEINNNPNILPNITLGYHATDYCNNANNAIDHTLQILSGPTTTVPNYCCNNHGRCDVVTSLRLSALSHSHRTDRKKRRILHPAGEWGKISFGATDSHFSNKQIYPSFFQTLPSDQTQYLAIAKLLKHFSWTWIGVIASDDESGEKQTQELRKVTEALDICIEFIIKIDPNEFTDQISLEKSKKIFSSSTSRIVVFCGTVSFSTMYVMELECDEGREKTFIVPASSVIHVILSAKKKYAFLGSLVFSPPTKKIPHLEAFLQNISLETRPNDTLLEQILASYFNCSTSHPSLNDLLESYYNIKLHTCKRIIRLGELGRQVYNTDAFGTTYQVYKAVYAIAHALHEMQIYFYKNSNDSYGKNPKQLHKIQNSVLHNYPLQELNNLLDKGLNTGILTKKQYDYMLVESPVIPILHALPKTHKGINPPPMRPIVSGTFYLQQRGVSMGAKFSPSLANLVMAWWEESFLFSPTNTYAENIHWFRSLDVLQIVHQVIEESFREENINAVLRVYSVQREKYPTTQRGFWAPPGTRARCNSCLCIPFFAAVKTCYEIIKELSSLYKGSCQKCPEDQWPNDNDRCEQKIIEYLSYRNDPIALTVSIISTFCFVKTAVILVMFFRYRETPIIKAQNQSLSFIILVSIMISFLLVFLFLCRPVHFTCILCHTLFEIIFSIAISCILAKTLQVYMAFKATKPGSVWKHIIGPKMTNCVVFIFSLIPILVSIVWLSVAPPFPENNSHIFVDKIFLQCNVGSILAFSILLGYMGLLAAVSFFIAFLARNLPDSFNEAKNITFSMLVVCSVWVAFIPAYMGVTGKNTILVEIFAILASNFGILGCIFIPKCYIILMRPELNSKSYLLKQSHLRH